MKLQIASTVFRGTQVGDDVVWMANSTPPDQTIAGLKARLVDLPKLPKGAMRKIKIRAKVEAELGPVSAPAVNAAAED